MKITQDQLVQSARVSRRTIITIEAGEADIRFSRLTRILLALGLHSYALFSYFSHD
ncbi:hypothetical protein [Undibacterium sp. CCC3.4]